MSNLLLGLAGAFIGVGFFYAGQMGAIVCVGLCVFAYFKFGKKASAASGAASPAPLPTAVPTAVPTPTSPSIGKMSAFYNAMLDVTNNVGGASTRNIVVAIANLADTRGLWRFDYEDFSNESTISSGTLVQFCRINPKHSTLQDIPGVGPEIEKLFQKKGYNDISSLLSLFCRINNMSDSPNKPLPRVLDEFFAWVKSVHPGTEPNFHTVVHCTAALADEIELIDLASLGTSRDGDLYKESVSACTAESIKDFLDQFDNGRGELGPITDIKGVGPKAQKAFKKVDIMTVEDLLDKFATFLM